MKLLKVYLVSAVFVFTACQNHKSEVHNDEHDQSHEAIGIQHTAYNSEYEVFIEIEPFVVNQRSGILVHITKLPDFQPLTDGEVTSSLIIGKKGIRQKLDKPTRKGIYLFELQPEVEGRGYLKIEIRNNDSVSTLHFNNIEVFTDEHYAIHEAEHHQVNNPNAITFTKEQSWKIDFATGLVKQKLFGPLIKSTAFVQSAQIDEIIVPAKITGIVDIEKTLVEGSEVSKGKTILKISGSKLADNNMAVRFNEAKNNLNNAEANYERTRILAEDKIVSQKELLDVKNKYENARVIFDNLKKNFNENGENVISPINGFVRHLYVGAGEYVAAGSPLVSLIKNKDFFLKVEVQQKYATFLPYLKTANIRLPYSGKVYSLEELNGKIVSIGKNVSDYNYLIPLTLQIENRGEILPGSFVDIFLKTEMNTNEVVVPNSALLEEQSNYFVLVQLTPESFEKREVKIGGNDGFYTQIISGLSVSERIVTKGAVLVKLAAVSNSLDPHAGHVH